jgi:colanic acid biosynthesis glycosyl transferase WcaI
MNILLITDPYPPQLYSISLMMKQLAEELTVRGNKVTVVTPWPRNNMTSEDRLITYNEFSTEKDVNVIRVKTLPLHNISFILRGISQLLMPPLFWDKIRKYCQFKIDVVLVYSPPLTLSILGNKIKRRFGARYILNVQDIFPQSPIDLGIMRNKILIRFFEYMEQKAYRNADIITSHTINSRKFLIEKKNVHPDKIHYIPNWIDMNPYLNIRRTNSFRKKCRIEDKFVLLFAGVMGIPQGLDVIVKAANEVSKILSDMCFLIVGDGMEKGRLMRMAQGYSINNVIFHPFVSQEEYPELVKEADAGLVCLSSQNKTPVVPGKMWGYMAASIPIVAFLNRESDGHTVIKEAKCGYSIVSEASSEEAKNLLIRIFSEKNKLREYGENGHRYMIENFTKDVCLNKLIDMIA